MKKITELYGDVNVPMFKKFIRGIKLTSLFIMFSVLSVSAGERDSQVRSFDQSDEQHTTLTSPDVLNKESQVAVKQQTSVSGTVSDESGAPLPGVTVTVKGTITGTITGADGEYTLTDIPEDATLVFSFVGMKTQEIEVGNQSTINVTMVADAIGLEEVVAIGYGSQNKSKITGSVSFVDSKELEDAIFTGADQMLQGRSPGVNIVNTSGEPGADVRIRIRGNNSLRGNNDPLWVVDGVPISGTPNFSPQDITSFEVLKDAAATSIYGSRGANGVVLVTTKRGTPGETELTFSVNHGVTESLGEYDVLQGAAYAQYRNEVAAETGSAMPFSNPDDYEGKGFDWQDKVLQSGYRQEYSLGFTGGSEKVNFYLSGNYITEEGIFINTDFQRSNLRANLDFNVSEFIDIKFSNAITYTVRGGGIFAEGRNLNTENQGGLYNAAVGEPLVSSIDYNGINSFGNQFLNPYNFFMLNQRRRSSTRILSSVETTFKITESISFINNSSIDFRFSNNDQFSPPAVGGQALETNGSASLDNIRNNNYVTSNFFRFSKLIADRHDVNVLAGVEYSEFNHRSSSIEAYDFALTDFGVDNIGISNEQMAGSNRRQSVIQSGFMRLDYTYDSKYLFNGTWRADGASVFADDEKWAYFPSFGAAWIASNEDFLSGNPIVSNLKIRGSWGQVGSQAIAPYQSQLRFESSSANVSAIGNQLNSGIQPSNQAGNSKLKWETTTTLDLGFDLGLMNNALELSFSYYNKNTEDLLQQISLPQQDGFKNILVNLGEIENKGFEIGLYADLFRNNEFSWSTGLNVTANQSKVIDIGPQKRILGGTALTNAFVNVNVFEPGQPFGAFYGLESDGLIQESDFDEEGNPTFAPYNGGTTLGANKYVNQTDDEVVNVDDRVVIGNPNPDAVIGWNNDFSYKNFSLNLFFHASIGNDVANATYYLLTKGSPGTMNQLTEYADNRWTESNPTNDARYPRAGITNPTVFSDLLIEDGSYLRFKNLSLRYNVPLPSSWDIKRLEVSLTATNLFTITNYSGLDPEVSSYDSREGNSNKFGIDMSTYPTTRMMSMGLKINF